MYLHKRDIEKITKILETFPDVDTFELTQEGESGIGNILSMTFTQEVNSVRGSFNVEVSGIENW